MSGILFSAPMVAALLDGRKTQTRRILKPQFDDIQRYGWRALRGATVTGKIDGQLAEEHRLPYWAGDRLYVRESYWQRGDWIEDSERVTKVTGVPKWLFRPISDEIIFDEPAEYRTGWQSGPDEAIYKRLGRFMPRRYSRLTLTVTDLKIERLQDISEADAIAEGLERVAHPRGIAWKSYETYPDGTPHPHAVVPNSSPITSYRELWDSINGPGSWDANPWVIATTFTVEQKNIDA